MQPTEIFMLGILYVIIHKIINFINSPQKKLQNIVDDFNKQNISPSKYKHTAVEVLKFFHDKKVLTDNIFDRVNDLRACPNLDTALLYHNKGVIKYTWDSLFDTFKIKCTGYDVIVFKNSQYVLSHDLTHGQSMSSKRKNILFNAPSQNPKNPYRKNVKMQSTLVEINGEMVQVIPDENDVVKDYIKQKNTTGNYDPKFD